MEFWPAHKAILRVIPTAIEFKLACWLSTPSIWFTHGFVEEAAVALQPGQMISKPTGMAKFIGEPVFTNPPRSWAERMFNIVHWNEIEQGGHFAAMEQPELFADDVAAFARLIDD